LDPARVPAGQPHRLAHRRLTLLDVERLQTIAGFNQDYLQLEGAPPEARSYIDRLERNSSEMH
jgi:hypothetical protein